MHISTTLANLHLIARNNESRRYNALEKHAEFLSSQVRNLLTEVQGSTDITTNTDSTASRHYVGTPAKYNSYDKQVTQLGKLYENIADWGCMIAKNIIDLRTAFSVGEGVKVIKRVGFEGDAKQELVWVKEFMRYNNLDEEMPQEYAKEAEIEGKILLRLLLDRGDTNIRVVHTPWRKFMYEITTPAHDFFNYINAKYTGSGEPRVSFDVPAPMFVYKRFGGSTSKINETPPKTAFVLREIEDLDKALWDWRKINRLFTAPTPVITAPDKQTAKEIKDWVDGSNWKIGKLLVLGGDKVKFELVGWKGDGYTTIKEETQALAKTISGTTGVPVHFLGYPELLSNRDTAENLIQLLELTTSKERRTWVGAYEELFQKAMVMYNTEFGANLNPLAINATIKKTNLITQPGKSNAPVSNSNNTSPGSE